MDGFARAIGFVVLTTWMAGPARAADGYVEKRAAAVRKCEAVDPLEYQSGLAFNPDGLRSYYARSACFQGAATMFRDESLCPQVKERWTLLWSSWGYSEKQCRKLVAEGAAKDRKILDEMKSRQLAGGVKLRDFSIERNGNRRDFDIVPLFDRGEAHQYTLRVEILGAGAARENVTVAEAGHYLYGNENLRIYVRQSDIRQRFPGFELDHRYQVRATLILGVGNGSVWGMWSDAFAERAFPVAARSQYLVKEATFRP